MNKFQLGDKVRIKGEGAYFIPPFITGTVVHVASDNGYGIDYGIEFDINTYDEYGYGHDCEGHARQGYGYYFKEDDLELVETEQIKRKIRWYSKGRFSKWEENSNE